MTLIMLEELIEKYNTKFLTKKFLYISIYYSKLSKKYFTYQHYVYCFRYRHVFSTKIRTALRPHPGSGSAKNTRIRLHSSNVENICSARIFRIFL